MGPHIIRSPFVELWTGGGGGGPFDMKEPNRSGLCSPFCFRVKVPVCIGFRVQCALWIREF